MDTMDLARDFLKDRLTLGDLHAALQARTWAEDDEFADDLLHVIAEATSAEWGRNSLEEEVRKLIAAEESHRARRVLARLHISGLDSRVADGSSSGLRFGAITLDPDSSDLMPKAPA